MVATAAPPLRPGCDALGRRVEKVVPGATYRYIYSGVETVSVYTSAGTWKQDYVYGPVIEEVIMLEQADLLDADGDSNTSEPARSWYMRDALGSVMLVEEQDRTEAVTYRYDPYGIVTITRGGASQSGDPLGQHVTCTGRWRDEETGLYHYRGRTYDPVRGRSLQRDPLGAAAGPNLHCDASMAPSRLRDPLAEEKGQREEEWRAELQRLEDELDAARKRADGWLEQAKQSATDKHANWWAAVDEENQRRKDGNAENENPRGVGRLRPRASPYLPMPDGSSWTPRVVPRAPHGYLTPDLQRGGLPRVGWCVWGPCR